MRFETARGGCPSAPVDRSTTTSGGDGTPPWPSPTGKRTRISSPATTVWSPSESDSATGQSVRKFGSRCPRVILCKTHIGHRDYESVCQRTSFKAHQFARRLARQPACTPEQSARSAVIARRADSIPSGGRPRSRTARASRRVDRMGLNLDGKTAIQCSENEKNRQNRGKPVAVPAGWRNRRVSAETDAPTGTPPHSVKSRALLPRVDLATRRE